MAVQPCAACHGARLRPESLAVRVGGKNAAEHTGMSVSEAARFFGRLKLSKRELAIATPILKEIRERLGFLENGTSA